MHYNIDFPKPQNHFIDLTLNISNIQSNEIDIQLPCWRPGRYEIQNFESNIPFIKAFSANNKQLKLKKTQKGRWKIDTEGFENIKVFYQYYANYVDGGNSFVDEDQLYINFINCCFYVEGRINEPYNIDINIPRDYEIATGLDKKEKNKYKAKDFYELVDSPLLASQNLQKINFKVNDVNFYLIFQGKCEPPWEEIKKQFPAFIKYQMEIFGEFPENEYYFIYHVLPYRFFHGVEHKNSTVIILGKEDKFENTKFTKIFQGISAHELFHVWNVKYIRPKALLPYDFTQENYFETCYIAEGVTTYYGDYSLIKSNVWSAEEYFAELNDNLKKHLDNGEHNQQSLAESSIDLWVDGYKKGIPGKKVSVYDKGALAALILDIEILKSTFNNYSLDDVMKKMWEKFGKEEKGYTTEDYKQIVEELTGQSFDEYFNRIIYGNEAILPWIKNVMEYVGCELIFQESQYQHENLFGFKINQIDGYYRLTNIALNSPAHKNNLNIDDTISKVNGIPVHKNLDTLYNSALPLVLTIQNNDEEKNINLNPAINERYFTNPEIQKKYKASAAEKENFGRWTGNNF